MKRLLMVVAVVMVFGVGNAMAQEYAADVVGNGWPFDYEVTCNVGQTFSFDVYLEGVPGPATSGGVYVAFTSSTSVISYVSAGRALTDGSEGLVGSWNPTLGGVINQPDGPGTLAITVVQSGGASPDGNGNIPVAEVTLRCDAPGDGNIRLRTIPSVLTWLPTPLYDDNAINAATSNPTLTAHCIYVPPPTGDFCKGDFNYDLNVDANDVGAFLEHFGRSIYSNPCPPDGPAPVARTGQTTSYATGDDGDLEGGVDLGGPRFIDNGDDTVSDKLTGLMWEKYYPGVTTFWSAAVFNCANSTFNGHDDWRLPTIKELLSLVDYSEEGPAIDDSYINVWDPNDYLWSSTSLVSGGSAWYLYLWNGDTGMAWKSDSDKYALCVRGGH